MNTESQGIRQLARGELTQLGLDIEEVVGRAKLSSSPSFAVLYLVAVEI